MSCHSHLIRLMLWNLVLTGDTANGGHEGFRDKVANAGFSCGHDSSLSKDALRGH